MEAVIRSPPLVLYQFVVDFHQAPGQDFRAEVVHGVTVSFPDYGFTQCVISKQHPDFVGYVLYIRGVNQQRIRACGLGQ